MTAMISMVELSVFNLSLCSWSDKVDFSVLNAEDVFPESPCDDQSTPLNVSSNWCQVCSYYLWYSAVIETQLARSVAWTESRLQHQGLGDPR